MFKKIIQSVVIVNVICLKVYSSSLFENFQSSYQLRDLTYYLSDMLDVTQDHITALLQPYEEDTTLVIDLPKLIDIDQLSEGKIAYHWSCIWQKISLLDTIECLEIIGLDDYNKFISDFPPNLKRLFIRKYSCYETFYGESLFERICKIKTLELLHYNSSGIRYIPDNICNLTNLKTINLNYNKLDCLNCNLWQMTQLIGLSLSHNNLGISSNNDTHICNSVYKLENLETLEIENNHLRRWPTNLRHLKKLKNLNVSQNGLKHYSASLKGLMELKILILNRNPLKGIPKYCKQWRKLERLSCSAIELTELSKSFLSMTWIKHLDISNNLLSSSIQKLAAFTNLEKLYINNIIEEEEILNGLDFLGSLTKINTLKISKNNLLAIPNQLSRLRDLENIDLSGNNITSIEDIEQSIMNVLYLSLANNYITKIPEGMKKLRCLRRLDLSRNLFTSLPIWLFEGKSTFEGKPTIELVLNDLNKLEPITLSNEYLGFEEIYSRYMKSDYGWSSKDMKIMRKNITQNHVEMSYSKHSLVYNFSKFKTIKCNYINIPNVYDSNRIIYHFSNIMNEINFSDPTDPNTYVSAYEFIGGEDNMNKYFSSSSLGTSNWHPRPIEAEVTPEENNDWIQKVFRPFMVYNLKVCFGIDVKKDLRVNWALRQATDHKNSIAFILQEINKKSKIDKISIMSQLINGLLNCETGQTEALNTILFNLSNSISVENSNFIDSISNDDYKADFPHEIFDEYKSDSSELKNGESNIKAVIDDSLEGCLFHQIGVIKNQWLARVILPFCEDDEHNTHIVNHYRQRLSQFGFSNYFQSFADIYESLRRRNDPFSDNVDAVMYYFYSCLTPDRLCDELMQYVQTKEDLRLYYGSLERWKFLPCEIKEMKSKVKKAKQERPLTNDLITIFLNNHNLLNTKPSLENLKEGNVRMNLLKAVSAPKGFSRFFDEDPLEPGSLGVMHRDGMMEILIELGIVCRNTAYSMNKIS